MPYILKDLRLEIDVMNGGDDVTDYLSTLTLRHFSGALNYLIYKNVKAWLMVNGINYFNISALLGSIDASKEEFRRRILNDYEDEKIKENGDI